MKLSGERSVGTPRQVVWAEVNDHTFLREVIPGCQHLERISATRFNAVVRVSVEPRSCRLVGEGRGGVADFVKGSALVTLSEEGKGTTVSHDVEAQIEGKLAQFGSRVIQGVATKLVARFFGTMAANLKAGDTEALTA